MSEDTTIPVQIIVEMHRINKLFISKQKRCKNSAISSPLNYCYNRIEYMN